MKDICILAAVLAFVVQAAGVQLRAHRNMSMFLDQPKPKIFFLAGVEGSGVSLFESLWKAAFTDGHHEVIDFPPQWGCGMEWGFSGFYEMRDRLRNLTQNGLQALTFQASFPSCGVRLHEHDGREHHFHPQLEWVRLAAEEAGVEFHVVLLDRKLKECLALTCIRRHNEDCDLQARSLKANAIILRKQLEALGRGAVSCFQYPDDQYLLKQVRTNFGGWVPDLIKKFAARRLNTTALSVLASLTDETKLLEEPDTALRELCKGVPSFTLPDFRAFVERANASRVPEAPATAEDIAAGEITEADVAARTPAVETAVPTVKASEASAPAKEAAVPTGAVSRAPAPVEEPAPAGGAPKDAAGANDRSSKASATAAEAAASTGEATEIGDEPVEIEASEEEEPSETPPREEPSHAGPSSAPRAGPHAGGVESEASSSAQIRGSSDDAGASQASAASEGPKEEEPEEEPEEEAGGKSEEEPQEEPEEEPEKEPTDEPVEQPVERVR